MPELIPFSEWSSINQVSDNPEGLVKYANYVRDQYIEEKTYDQETEIALQKSLGTAFQAKQFDPAEIEEAIKPKPFSFDEKFNLVSRAGLIDFTPEEYAPVGDYRGFLAVAKPETTPDYDRLLEEKRAAAQPVVEQKFQSSVEQLVARGDLPFARIELPDGKFQIIGGSAADDLDPFEAYRKSIDSGAVRPEDMAQIQKLYEVPEGYTKPSYKLINYGNALKAVDEAFKADPELQKRILNPLSFGYQDLEDYELSDLDYGIAQVLPEYTNIPEEDRVAALDFMFKSTKMAGGYQKFDEDDPKNNLIRSSYGDYILHRDAFVKTDVFEGATSDLPEEVKKTLETQRQAYMEASFEEYSPVIQDTYLKDEWLEAVAAGKAENKTNAQIFQEFFDKQDYSYFKNEIRDHIGESLVESVTDIIHGVNAAVFKSDYSREIYLKDLREKESRKRLANMFGQDIGMGVELGSMVAPVIADMLIGAGLAAFTGGLSATAVVSKNVAQASLKGVVRSMAGSVLRKTATESAETAAERALASSLASEVGTKATAKQFFDTYYKVASNKITTNSAFFATASTRSGVMTYATVYDALDGKGLTDEERHEKAASAGLTAGLITGGITVGFNLLGRAGLEGFLNAGATRGQFRKYFDLIVGKGFNDVKANDLFDRTVATIAKKGLASTWKDVAKYHFKNFSDEALEEGLDEFVNSYVVSSATGDDMPLQDRLTSAGMAAFYGGVFGLGMPVAQRTLGRLVTDQQAVVQRTVVDDIVEKLRGTDSELTAQAVIDRLNRGPVRPKPTAPAPEAASSEPTTTAISIQPPQQEAASQEGGPSPTPSPDRFFYADLSAPLSPEVVRQVDEQLRANQGSEADIESYVAEEQAIDADVALSDTQKEIKKHQLKIARRIAQILQQNTTDDEKKRSLGEFWNLIQGEIEQPTDPSRSTPEDVEKALELLRTATNEQHEIALQAAIAAEPPKAKAKNKSNKAPKPAVSPKAAKKVTKKAAKKVAKKAAKKVATKATTKVAKKAAKPTEPEIEVEPEVETEADFNVSEAQIDTIRQKAIEEGVDPDAAVADVQDKIASLEAYSLESQKPEEAPVSEAPVVVETPLEPEGEGMFGDISKEADHIRLTAQHLSTKVQRILDSGISVEVSSANPYGLPLDSIKHVKKLSDNFDLSNFGEATPKDLKSIRAINRFIKSRIAEKYPQLPMDTAVKLFEKSSPKKPTLRTKKVQGVEFRYDEDSKLGVFDNNPRAIARMLKAGMKVPVPIDPKRITGTSRYLKNGSVLNPSIQVERAGKKGDYYVTDVSVVDPNDPSRQISLVYDKFKPVVVLLSTERAAAMDAVLTVNESFTLNLESSFETRGKDTLTVFDGSPIEVGDAINQFSYMLEGAYRLMTADNRAEVVNRLTPQQVMLSKFLGSIVRRLTPSNAANIARDNAKNGAIVDFYYDSVRAIKMLVIRQTLDQTGAIALDPETGKLKIKNSPEVIETLAGFITLPVDESGNVVVTDYTPSRGKEPFATDTPLKQKASYILNHGFSGSGEGGKADVLTTASGTTPKPDWAEITLLSYFDREINALVSQSSKNNQNLNLAGIAATAAGRIKENLSKFQSTLEQTGTTQTSLDSLQESGLQFAQSEEDLAGVPTEIVERDKQEADQEGENVAIPPESYSKFPEEMQDAARSLIELWSLSPDADLQVFKQVALKAGVLSRETINKTNNTQKLFSAIMQPFMQGFAESEIIMNEFQAAADSLNPITRSALVTYGVIEDINLSEDVRSAHRKARRESSISYDAPAIIDEIHAEYIRSLNDAEITRLNLESGNPQSVVDALKTIAETSDSESNRNVASLLLKHQALLLNTGFAIEDSPSGPAGSFTVFSNDDTVVTINKSQTYGDGLESVLLHEYVHAVTARLLGLPPSSMTKDQRAALARLKGLYEMAKQNSTSDSIEVTAGLSNFAEFIAAMFSSPTFQNEMQVLTDAKTKKSFFEKILDALLDFFGIRNNSVLRKSFDDLVTFVELGYSVNHMSTHALIDRAVSNGRRNAEQMVKVPFLRETSEVEVVVEQDAVRFSLFGTDGPEIEVTGQQQARIDKLIDEAVSSLIPKAVPVSVVRNAADAEAFNARPDAGIAAVMVEKDGVSTPAIFIARDNIAKAMANVQTTVEDDFHAKAILEALIHEELAHVSEFKALPTESIDEIADSMTQYEFEQVIDSYTSVESINADLKTKVAENDIATKRQIVGEMLRMQVQKITRGTTTEEDIAFYMTNPSLARVLLRHLVNVFRKLYARYNLSKSNPELAIAVNRMATQMAFLSQSGSSTDPVLSFDPRSPDEAMNILERRFAAMAADVTDETPDETITDIIKDLMRTLEVPVGVYEGGSYKPYSGLKKFLMGSLDPRVVELKKKEQMFKNAIESLGNSALVRFEKIRKKHPEITDELINRASGSTESDRPSKEFRDAAAQLMREWRRDTRKKVADGELPANALSDEAKTEAYQRIVVSRMAAERKRLNADVRRKVSEALAEIRSSSPELAQAILDVRQLIDAMSDTMKKTYGLNEKLQAKFDSQMGIYITRAYRAFNEVGYIDKILADTDSKVYQDAHNFFRSEWLRSKARFERSVDKKLTKEASMTKAEEALQTLRDMNIDPVHNAMQLYLYSRDITKRRSYKLPEGVTKSLIDSLRKRDNIPVEIRNLLGEYGPEEGIKNMFRTLTVVTNMLSRQATYNNLIKVGRLRQVTDANGNQVEQGFVMTHEEIKARFGQQPDLAGWVNLRTGKKVDVTQKESGVEEFERNYDFTYSYYAPEEMVTNMHERFDPKNSLAEIDSTEKGVSNVVSSLNFLTGASLSAKTLFSAGFYIRNILGNVLFFGPSQGFILTPKVAKTLYAELKRAAFTPEQVDVYRAELISFGIIGEDIFSKQISELFDNSFNIDEANKEIGKLTKMARKAATFSERNAVMKRLRAVSAAVDAFYKIAYFEHEIKTLKKARDYDLKNNTNTGYRDLSDYDIKSQAAVKVRKTAQSYADSLHLVEAVSKKYGAFLTPFLRFKTEVPRIMVNTWTLSGQEMRSDNPVIKWRGRKRRAGIIGVSTAFGMLLPTVFRLMAGIGEDEDELMRESVPPYLRLNTFFYTGEKGDLQSWDLTFLNPYAMMTDPLLRFGEKMWRGEPSQAIADMLASYLGTYADIQIFANAVLDVKRNQKSRDGQAIYSQNDGMEIFYKSFKYILSEAYGVRTPTKLVEALKAATVGDDAPDPDAYSPLQIMLNEVMPVRPHPVDPEQMMTRFLLKKRDERAQARSELNRLLTRQSLSQDDIRDTAREWADKNADINAQIHRGIRAASSLGLSYDKVVNSMSRTGVRKDMQVYLTLGLMPRSELSTPFKEALINLTPDGAVGLQRLMFAQDELNKQGAELIPLNP